MMYPVGSNIREKKKKEQSQRLESTQAPSELQESKSQRRKAEISNTALVVLITHHFNLAHFARKDLPGRMHKPSELEEDAVGVLCKERLSSSYFRPFSPKSSVEADAMRGLRGLSLGGDGMMVLSPSGSESSQVS